MSPAIDDILNAFYNRLRAADGIDASTIEEMQRLFESGEKLTADDIVSILEKDESSPE